MTWTHVVVIRRVFIFKIERTWFVVDWNELKIGGWHQCKLTSQVQFNLTARNLCRLNHGIICKKRVLEKFVRDSLYGITVTISPSCQVIFYARQSREVICNFFEWKSSVVSSIAVTHLWQEKQSMEQHGCLVKHRMDYYYFFYLGLLTSVMLNIRPVRLQSLRNMRTRIFLDWMFFLPCFIYVQTEIQFHRRLFQDFALRLLYKRDYFIYSN